MPDQTDLRDRIADAIWAQYRDVEPSRTGLVLANPHAVADVVLAVLRGLTLRELEQLYRPNTPPSRPERRCPAREPLDGAQCLKQAGHEAHSDRPGRIWYPVPDAEAQQQPDTETWDLPDARPGTTDHTLTRQAATVDPVVCPRCKGDNREAFALCPDCTEADGRLLCPRCREDITDYAEDDRVWRTGDDRPYCSMECVIAAHRAGLPTAAMEGAAAADTSEEEHRG